MIRQRRGLSIAAAAAPAQFGPLWKFRLIVTCPPGETVGARGILAGQAKRDYEFGPGDTGWIELEELHQLQVLKAVGASTATVELWWADEKEDRVYPAPAAAGSGVGSVIYDSGSVAAGAAIDSGVLDLSTVNALEVIVDNTAGTVLRDLSLLSYLADGATLIDSTVLRRCAFGAAPAGSLYAPGAIRGLVSPHPPGGTTGSHVLYDATSAANTAADTGAIFTEDMDAVLVKLVTSAAIAALSPLADLFAVEDDGTSSIYARINGFAGITTLSVLMSHGTQPIAAVNYPSSEAQVAAMPVPRRVRFTNVALGVGITGRVLIMGRGRVPGTFSVPMALPTRAKLTLGAGGAGAARVTVIAR